MIHLTRNCLKAILILEGKLKKNSWDDNWSPEFGRVGPWACGAFTQEISGYVQNDAKHLFLNQTFKPYHMNTQEKINCQDCIKIMKEHGL